MMNTSDPGRKKLKTDDNDVISHEHTATESDDEKNPAKAAANAVNAVENKS